MHLARINAETCCLSTGNTEHSLSIGGRKVTQRPTISVESARPCGSRTGHSGFANVSSYSKGINGLMLDMFSPAANLSAADFSFRIGSSTSPENWTAAPDPLSISIRPAAGDDDADRVSIVWADGAIKNTWLEVTILANENTGLWQPYTFYFGSRVGDAGVSNASSVLLTNAADEIAIRGATSAHRPIDNNFDITRDGLINAADEIIARSNTGALRMLNLPGNTPPATPQTVPLVAQGDSMTKADPAKLSAQPLAAPMAVVPLEKIASSGVTWTRLAVLLSPTSASAPNEQAISSGLTAIQMSMLSQRSQLAATSHSQTEAPRPTAASSITPATVSAVFVDNTWDDARWAIDAGEESLDNSDTDLTSNTKDLLADLL